MVGHRLSPIAAAMGLAVVFASGAQASSPTASEAPTATLGASALFPAACPSETPLISGTIATIAGTGVAGDTHDGGPATAAEVNPAPGTIAFDALVLPRGYGRHVNQAHRDGRHHHYVRRPVERRSLRGTCRRCHRRGRQRGCRRHRCWPHLADFHPAGTMTSIAGTGVVGSSGDEGQATNAQIGPTGIAIGPRGDLYFDDLNATAASTRAGSSTTSRALGSQGSRATVALPSTRCSAPRSSGRPRDARGQCLPWRPRQLPGAQGGPGRDHHHGLRIGQGGLRG